MQHLVEISACRAPRRSQAHQESRSEGDGETEAEHPPVKTEVKTDRDVGHFQAYGTDQAVCPYSDNYAQDSANGSQQDTFRQQLAHNAEFCRAQGRANRQFAFARRGANQNNVGNIGAGQQQHQSGKHHKEHTHYHHAVRGIGFRARESLRIEPVGYTFVRFRKFLIEPLRNNIHGSLRLPAGHAWFQHSQESQVARIARGPIVVLLLRRLVPKHAHANGQVCLHIHQGICSVKARRRYPNHRDGVAVHLYLPADNRRIAVETFFPVVIAEHHNIFSAALFRFRAIDQSSNGGFESQSLEKVSAHVAIKDRLNFAVMLHAGQAQRITKNVGKSLSVAADIMEVCIGNLQVRIAALLLSSKDDQTISVRYRQWPQHESIDGAEDSGIGANAQSKS